VLVGVFFAVGGIMIVDGINGLVSGAR